MLHLLGIVLHFKDETILVISSALVGGNEHKLEKGFFQIRQDIVKGKALRCNRFRWRNPVIINSVDFSVRRWLLMSILLINELSDCCKCVDQWFPTRDGFLPRQEFHELMGGISTLQLSYLFIEVLYVFFKLTLFFSISYITLIFVSYLVDYHTFCAIIWQHIVFVPLLLITLLSSIKTTVVNTSLRTRTIRVGLKSSKIRGGIKSFRGGTKCSKMS